MRFAGRCGKRYAIEDENDGPSEKFQLMVPLVWLLPSLHLLTLMTIPAGEQLRLRMETPVASWSSTVGTPIHAVLIAPVFVKGKVALPVGCTLSGRVKSVARVGLGIRHERAALQLEFTSLTFPNGGVTVPMETRVAEIDNGRERVSDEGVIQGVRVTGSICYRVSGYIKMLLLWQVHADFAQWAIKSLVVQLPEPEIDFPAGTEVTLRLTKQWKGFRPAAEPEQVAGVTDAELIDLKSVVGQMALRTTDGDSGYPSDLTNVLLVGSRSEVTAAFRAAGWELAPPLSLQSRIRTIRAASEMRGYSAPMASLLLNGEDADMSWQKGLNDLSKRHHVRIWKREQLWKGQELWVAAATRDVDYAYLRPGRAFSHRVHPRIDETREKVAYDLAYASCASPVAWIERAGVPRAEKNASGDSLVTDTRMAVVQLRECAASEQAKYVNRPQALVTHGGRWHRLLRREILITRNDLIRGNVYWRLYEAGAWVWTYAQTHREEARAAMAGGPDSSLSNPVKEPARWDAYPRWKAVMLALSALQ